MVKTICIPEELHKELVMLKLNQGDKNISERIKELIIAYKELEFLKSSIKFREMLNKKGISFEKFLKDAEKIREEVADELFPDI